MSVKTSPRRMTARRRASIVCALRDERITRNLGISPADRFTQSYARTLDLFESLGSPLTETEIAWIRP